jgi:hypothetical protein
VAYYKDLAHLTQYDGDMFKPTHKPGEQVTFSGVYRCAGCGKEISHNASVSLPPQNHHQHNASQGDIRWKLIVWATT